MLFADATLCVVQACCITGWSRLLFLFLKKHAHLFDLQVLIWLLDIAGCVSQLYLLNHIGEIPVELAAQAGHTTTTVPLMLEYMRANPMIFTPFEGSPEVHAHKAVKLGKFDDEMM